MAKVIRKNRKLLAATTAAIALLMLPAFIGGCSAAGKPMETGLSDIVIDAGSTKVSANESGAESESAPAVEAEAGSEGDIEEDLDSGSVVDPEVDDGEDIVSEDIVSEARDNSAPASEPAKDGAHKDGDKYEKTIMIEGMEEKVTYEHLVNETMGFAMDYECNNLTRQSNSDSEKLISKYDNANKPQNYLEVTYRKEDIDTVKASVKKSLSKTYKVDDGEKYKLDEGECIRIDASLDKNGKGTPDELQMVYLIPAGEGTYVATAHYNFEAAEGFGTRFANSMKTFSVLKK